MLIEVETIEDYMAALPEQRREAVDRLHQENLDQLPPGFEVGVLGGMINYYVPLSAYPAGYHCTPGEPLPFLALASQKNHIALYHMGLYMDEELATWFAKEYQEQVPTKLDMGKSCIRFKKPDDLALDVIAETLKCVTVEKYIAAYESALRRPKSSPAKRRKAGK